jgi:hypothetical protein
MPHNFTTRNRKGPPIGAAVIIVRIKYMKEQFKSCVGCRGYRTKKNQKQNLTREDMVADDR